MSDEVKNGEHSPHYMVVFDTRNLSEAGRIRMEMNLDTFANDLELGTATVRGLIDELKQQILKVIQIKRATRASKIVVPGQPAGLAVH